MEPPVPPDEADCCKSCCTPCIFDVYEEQLRKYNNYINNNLSNGSSNGALNCMSETSYAVFKLVQVTQHTRDTYLLTFEYLKPLREEEGSRYAIEDLSLVFQPGQHFLLRGNSLDSSEYFTRAYTPIPVNNSKLLSFTVLVRVYEDGVMSRYIRQLKLEDETLWRGPYGSFTFSNFYRHMLFIAQGTGIAPIFAVVKSLLGDDECEVFLKLFFCCRDCDDVLLRDELYEFASHWNFSYEVFLTQGTKVVPKYDEVINTRRLTDVDLGVYLRDKVGEKRVQVLICGSEKFSRDIRGYALALGVDSSHVFVF